jgi:hypothetical protein
MARVCKWFEVGCPFIISLHLVPEFHPARRHPRGKSSAFSSIISTPYALSLYLRGFRCHFETTAAQFPLLVVSLRIRCGEEKGVAFRCLLPLLELAGAIMSV